MMATTPATVKHTRMDDSFEQAKSFLSLKKQEADIHIVRPVSNILADAFRHYPVTSSLLFVFLVLSAIPLASFFGFALFAGSIIVGTAILFTLFWGAIVVGSAIGVLFAVLSITFAISLFIVSSGFASFLAFRFVQQIQQSESGITQGVKNFGKEVKQRTLGGAKVAKEQKSYKEKGSEKRPTSPSSSSSDSWKMESDDVKL